MSYSPSVTKTNVGPASISLVSTVFIVGAVNAPTTAAHTETLFLNQAMKVLNTAEDGTQRVLAHQTARNA